MPEPSQGKRSKNRTADTEGTFAWRLESAMKAAGLSQNALAEALEMSKGTVSPWFTAGAYPGGYAIVRLPELLGVDGHWLLTGEGTMKRSAAPVEERNREVGAEPISDRERAYLAGLAARLTDAIANGPPGEGKDEPKPAPVVDLSKTAPKLRRADQ